MYYKTDNFPSFFIIFHRRFIQSSLIIIMLTFPSTRVISSKCYNVYLAIAPPFYDEQSETAWKQRSTCWKNGQLRAPGSLTSKRSHSQKRRSATSRRNSGRNVENNRRKSAKWQQMPAKGRRPYGTSSLSYRLPLASRGFPTPFPQDPYSQCRCRPTVVNVIPESR